MKQLPFSDRIRVLFAPMFQKSRFSLSILLFAMTVFFVSCNDGEDEFHDTSVTYHKCYVALCEGSWNGNNTSMTVYNTETKKATDWAFLKANGKQLGDTGNDMQEHDGKLFIVMNVSGYIAVVNPNTMKLIKRIPTLDENGLNRQPRYIVFHNRFAYVSCFDGYVLKINLNTLTQTDCTKVGRNPEGMAIANGKLYVANSGGLDFNKPIGYDHTVSVVDLNTFKEVKKIEVGLNPYKVLNYNETYLYVNTRGDYSPKHPYDLCKIDLATDEVVKHYNLSVLDMTIAKGRLYFYSYDYSTEKSGFGEIDLATDVAVFDSPLQKGIAKHVKLPYDMTYDKKHDLFFVADAKDHTSSGKYLGFDGNGNPTVQFNTGISPNSIIYIP